jgi:cytochrome c oxidase subunit IV
MSQHIIPKKIYIIIFIALLLLTYATVKVATMDLGPLNTLVALSIAVFKAMLVLLYFMHLRYSSRLTWLFIGAGFFWLLLLIGLTFSDFVSRGWLPLPGGWMM